MQITRRPALASLEAGRFVAAAAVVLFHYAGVIEGAGGGVAFAGFLRPGHAGVPYFFVLSGFIIMHVHARDMGRAGAVRSFALKRAIRLLPMFWAISLAMLAGFLAFPGLVGARAISPAGLLADLLLLPHRDAILSISWTLRHEVVFYAVFALALALGPRVFWLLPLWSAVSLIGSSLSADVGALGLWSIVASPLNLGFGLGVVVAALGGRPRRLPAGLLAAAGGVAFAAIWLLEWGLSQGTPHNVAVLGATGEIGYLAASAILIHGLVGLETGKSEADKSRAGKSRAGRPIPAAGLWKVLGGSSYLLYLVHQPLASVAVRVLPGLTQISAGLCLLALSAAAIAVAVAGHLLVERPVLAFLTMRAGRLLFRAGAA